MTYRITALALLEGERDRLQAEMFEAENLREKAVESVAYFAEKRDRAREAFTSLDEAIVQLGGKAKGLRE